jgi:NAD(P)H-hydrate epimerase
MLYHTNYQTPEAVSREEMQEIDRKAIEDLGIPAQLLMENAGHAVAEAGLELLQSRSLDQVVVVAGSGNNGGDGFVAARHLSNLNCIDDVKVCYTGSIEEDRGDGEAGKNLALLKHYDVTLEEVDPGKAEEWLPDTDASVVLIDALFGTGLSSDVRSPYDGLIRSMNQALFPILSIDVPSGLDADTGRPLGEAVEAYLTVTLAAPKEGLVRDEAIEYVGTLQIVDIQIPRKLLS